MADAIMTITSLIRQFCVGLLLFLHISIVERAALGLQKCPKGSFFDDVLQKCENCYAVCVDAALQRTEDECALCEDRIQSPIEDSHASSPETTPILVVALVIVIVVLMIVMVVIIAVNRRPLHRMCQRLQARLSLQDIRGNDTTQVDDNNGVRNHLHAAIVLIESPDHDPQNVLDYQQQKELDLKLARSGQKNVPTGSFEDVQETLLKSMN